MNRDEAIRAVAELVAVLNAIDTFNAVVDRVEARCMAADGDVTPTLGEMREDELRELWRAVQVIKETI